MSLTIETLVSCDGGRECTHDGVLLNSDMRWASAKKQRSLFTDEGWVHRRGKDYCPDCAKRLGFCIAQSIAK